MVLLIIINGSGTTCKARHFLTPPQGAWSGRSRRSGYLRKPLLFWIKGGKQLAAGLTPSPLQEFCLCMENTGVADSLWDRKANLKSKQWAPKVSWVLGDTSHSAGTWGLDPEGILEPGCRGVYETLYLEESSAGLLVPIGEETGDKLQYFSISSYRERTFFLRSEHWWGNELYVNLKLSFKIFPLSSPPAL